MNYNRQVNERNQQIVAERRAEEDARFQDLKAQVSDDNENDDDLSILYICIYISLFFSLFVL